jgi:hypothetical protein
MRSRTWTHKAHPETLPLYDSHFAPSTHPPTHTHTHTLSLCRSRSHLGRATAPHKDEEASDALMHVDAQLVPYVLQTKVLGHRAQAVPEIVVHGDVVGRLHRRRRIVWKIRTGPVHNVGQEIVHRGLHRHKHTGEVSVPAPLQCLRVYVHVSVSMYVTRSL